MKFPVITRRTTALLSASALCLAISAATVAPSAFAAGSAESTSATRATADTGWIRLAHLSPNTPAVDVYLYSFGNSNAKIVLHHVSYGTVSPYEPVGAGEYSVAMRAAGAAASSPAVLSTSVIIGAGQAYTVAGMGPESGLRLAVLHDDLTTPSGQSLVRVIAASLQQKSVSVAVGADAVVTKLTFGSASTYQPVSAGSATVHVTGGTESANVKVSLTADTVHSLVVLDGSNGLEVVDLEDAAGNAVMPAGGAATGFGGTAPRGPGSPAPWLAAIAAGVLLAVGGGWRLRRVSTAFERFDRVEPVGRFDRVGRQGLTGWHN